MFIEAGSHTIKPTATEKLLACHVAQDLKWKEHLLDIKCCLIKQLNQRLNGVLLVSKRASYSTRLMVANGVYLSKLVYLIQVWGATEDIIYKPGPLKIRRGV